MASWKRSGCSFCRYCGVYVAYDDATMTAVKQMETPSHHSGAIPLIKRQEVTAVTLTLVTLALRSHSRPCFVAPQRFARLPAPPFARAALSLASRALSPHPRPSLASLPPAWSLPSSCCWVCPISVVPHYSPPHQDPTRTCRTRRAGVGATGSGHGRAGVPRAAATAATAAAAPTSAALDFEVIVLVVKAQG